MTNEMTQCSVRDFFVTFGYKRDVPYIIFGLFNLCTKLRMFQNFWREYLKFLARRGPGVFLHNKIFPGKRGIVRKKRSPITMIRRTSCRKGVEFVEIIKVYYSYMAFGHVRPNPQWWRFFGLFGTESLWWTHFDPFNIGVKGRVS